MHKLITVYDKTIRQSWKLCLSILIIFLFKAWYHEFWFHSITFIFLQFSSVTQSGPTLCNPMDCSMPGFPVHHQLPELAQIHVHQVGDAIQPFHSLSFPLLTKSFPASGSFPMRQFFASGGQSTGASALASVLPVNIQGWFPLGLTALMSLQSTLKSLLQHYSSKASNLEHSAFFMVQLSHPYMTTGKTIALTRQTLSAK